MWASDAFLGQSLYRAKARLQALGIPILPRLAHRLAMVIAQISIGDPVLVHPGVYIAHGQVVIDGFVEIHTGAVISPFASIGLRGAIPSGRRLGRTSSSALEQAFWAGCKWAPERRSAQMPW